MAEKGMADHKMEPDFLVRIRQEKELYYHRELEVQLRKKDLEMEKLRKEVEKYYILAGEEEKDYSGQVLQHINDAYTDKKGAADANTIIEG